MTPPGHRAGHDDVVAEVALQLGFIRRFARTCGVKHACLDDFVQSVVVTALKRIERGEFNPPDPDKPLRDAMRGWLGGIVRFKAMDLRRRLAVSREVLVHGPTEDHPIDVEAVPSAEARTEARDELAALARLKMSPKQRQAVAMAAQGYSAPEIAARMRVPVDTVYTMLRRARLAYEAAVKRERAKGR